MLATEKAAAVLAVCNRMPAGSTAAAIAKEAGVSESWAAKVRRNRESRERVLREERERASRDEAAKVDGPTAYALGYNTPKQWAIREAVKRNPRFALEAKGAWYARIAAMAGSSPAYVQHLLDMDRCAAIGAARRAQEEEEAKLKVEVMPFGGNIGPISNFRGWVDVFSKFKILSEAYIALAQSRGDVYAEAFLKDIRDFADRASSRAALSREG